MTTETVLALMSFALVMSITPGPANFLLLASGANFGIFRTLPLLFGVSFGFLFMVFLVGLGLGGLLTQYPAIHTVLRIACGAYILWLAYKIGRSRSLGKGEDGMAKPLGFLQAALLQWVNPKAWTVALIVNVSYAFPGAVLPGLLKMIPLFAVVNLPSIGVWALSGSALRGYLSGSGRLAVFNVIMALLLVLSTIPMLLNA
ncbi:Cysteine/O-acetylserine efflux protein [Pseudodesulfovibrio hydrargyri]|uniref:Cysteine/O-acetylserine efflux protein n=1 Tax=Pseudodesulfovibrio hydrargyri TaxID=2125990 RepID=A0A1J5NB73_9BACT|nr:LysE family translocator [Pseudodesulfovibrio hydrargyri]OIQ48993.1 Cysteine/O-acetylserine efflux protein [Pseudodesulfovibrio hydrargyri]